MRPPSRPRRRTPRDRGAHFRQHLAHSDAGSLSATIPAPAWAKSRPPLRKRVRMAIASWTSPDPREPAHRPP